MIVGGATAILAAGCIGPLQHSCVDSPLVEGGAGRILAKANDIGAAGISQHVVDLRCSIREQCGRIRVIALQTTERQSSICDHPKAVPRTLVPELSSNHAQPASDICMRREGGRGEVTFCGTLAESITECGSRQAGSPESASGQSAQRR